MGLDGGHPSALFIGHCVPQPSNQNIGPWALRQLQALARAGVEVRTLRLTPWFPPLVRKLRRVRGVADAPPEHRWENIVVEYPRWPYYAVGPLDKLARENPWAHLRAAYRVASRRLRRAVREFKPDVIFAHHTAVGGYVAYRLSKEFGIPYVVTDHDFDEIGDCAKFPRRRELFDVVQRSAAQMIDVSNRMRDIRRSVFPDIQSVVVHNGADPVPEELRSKPRPPELQGKLVVNCVSAWYGRKGIPKLVEAFDLAAGQFPDAVLRLVGDGPDRPAVEAAIAAATHKAQIQVVGRVPHSQALQEMCWADIYALIGKDEPFATTYTEAMMAGLPLIWPSDCGHNDVLRDGVHGLQVPPWDVGATAAALGQMLADGGLRQRTGELNREFGLGSLTWDANARRLVEIFSAAAGAAPARPSGYNESE